MSKNLQNPGLEAAKSRSRGPPGRFGSVFGRLEPSGPFVEASWIVLNASRAVLEASWSPGGVLEPSWSPLEWGLGVSHQI